MAENFPIRVGFVGAGSICRTRHLPGLAGIAGVEVVAVANRSWESAKKVATDFGIRHVVHDWNELINRDDIDAVFIGTWPYMHKELSLATLHANKHVFCQARMAMDLTEARIMLAAAEASPNLVNMVCPPPTRMPFEPWIRQMIESDQLGQITTVELYAVNGDNRDTKTIHWREQKSYCGKQAMAIGIFAETLNAWVGPYEELSAWTSIPFPMKHDSKGNKVSIEVPQLVTLTGRLENGALAVEHHIGVATDQSTLSEQLTIWGTQGTIRYGFGNTIEFAPAGQPLQPVDVPKTLQRPWCVEHDFINAVRAAQQGNPWSVSPDFAEALLYMRKVQAIHESAAKRKAITLNKL